MDITGISMAMSQNKVMTQVGIAMMSNTMDIAETAGAAITNMIDTVGMEQSVNPNIGGNFNMTI